MENRLQYLNSEFNRIKIGKVYELLKKNQNPAKERKPVADTNMRHSGKEQNPIEIDVAEEQRERGELKLKQSTIIGSPRSSDRNSTMIQSGQFNPPSIMKKNPGGQPRTTVPLKVSFNLNPTPIPRYPAFPPRHVGQQNPVLVILEVTIDNTSQIWH